MSNTRFLYSASNALDDIQLVRIDYLHLGLIAYKRRNADICQWRAQLHKIRSELSCSAPFFQCIAGIKEPTGRWLQIQAYLRTELPKQEAPVVKAACFGPRHIAMHSIERRDRIFQIPRVNTQQS